MSPHACIHKIGYINKMLTFGHNLQRQNSKFVKTLIVAIDL